MTKANQKFWDASKKEKRIMIAKDVIKQLRLGRIVPKEGDYISIVGFSDNEGDLQFDKWFKNEINKGSKEMCKVCALGACFISTANLGNNITLDSVTYVGSWELKRKLAVIFSPKQLGLIESAFERNAMFAHDQSCNQKSIDRALNFGTGLHDRHILLKAIMENIIKNDGTFKP